MATATGLLLIFTNSVEAKSIWLKCGTQEINLDSYRERVSLTLTIGKVYQGAAIFTPNQINFEVQWLRLSGGGGVKFAYAIDRKSLAYERLSLHRAVIPGFADTGWVPSKSEPEKGTCSIMKTPPTAGNQI